jgi:hypothetical protein
MFRRLLLVAALAAAPLTAPLIAAADAVASVTLTPRNDREVGLMRLGLGLYALREHLRDGGTIRQFGQQNAATLVQGSGNWGLIEQRGTGHTAALEQSGTGNVQGVFQSGKGTFAAVNQTGGQTGIVIQYGF